MGQIGLYWRAETSPCKIMLIPQHYEEAGVEELLRSGDTGVS